MAGKVVLVTGATGGLGRETARALAAMGARLVLACRDTAGAEATRAGIAAEAGSPVPELVRLDLASFDSVRVCAREVLTRFDRLDVLVNCAGTFSMQRRETADGLELTMGTNYFGPVLLTALLLPLLTRSPGARVVNVSSKAALYGRLDLGDLGLRRGYHGFRAYAASKLALNLFTAELAERLRGTGVAVNACHPGHVNTGIWPTRPWYMALASLVMKPFWLTPEEGARPVVRLAASPEVEGVTGRFFCGERALDAGAGPATRALREGLWAATVDLLGLAWTSCPACSGCGP